MTLYHLCSCSYSHLLHLSGVNFMANYVLMHENRRTLLVCGIREIWAQILAHEKKKKSWPINDQKWCLFFYFIFQSLKQVSEQ